MQEYTLKSGKELRLAFAGLTLASKLKRVIQKELIKIDIKLPSIDGDIKASDIKKINVNSDLINSLKNALFIIDSSEELQDVVFECLSKSTYDKERITKELFDNEDAISDYYEILWRCIEKNLSPFFRNHLTSLDVLTKITGDILNTSTQEMKKTQ